MSSDTFVPSKSEIEKYNILRADLTEIIRRDGALFIKDKPVSGYVGLLNQGATCYLNSLIQGLYNIVEFRNLVFSQKSDIPVVKELQRLFASLSLSDYCAVSTKGLTSAFGWSTSEVFEQHDIQELFSILLNGLSGVSKDLEKSVNELFQGQLKDTLECPQCSFKKELSTSFLDIPVSILERPEDLTESMDGTLPGVTLRYLLKSAMKPEVLDVDNLWCCSKCNKNVQAVKSIQYTTLAPVVMLHLKRFQYDPVTRRRLKLSYPVLFSDFLDASLIQPGAEGTYIISAVLLHVGSATSGHYRAYARRGDGKWVDYNDSEVTLLEDCDVKSLFWYSRRNDQENGLFIQDMVYENAYVLIYRRSDVPIPTEIDIPEVIRQEIEASNEKFGQLRDAYQVHQKMVELQVFFSDSSKGSLTEVMLQNTTLKEATETLYHLSAAAGLIDGSSIPIERCRLRRFNPESKHAGETYGGREGGTLIALGIHPVASLILETRVEGEVFIEFNPREMGLRLLVWDGKTDGASVGDNTGNRISGSCSSVIVPGEEQATVGALRKEAAAATGVPTSQILLIRADHKITNLLDDDSRILRRDCGLWPGEEVVVEVIPNGSDPASYVSGALQLLRSGVRNIRLNFNNPNVKADGTGSPKGVNETEDLLRNSDPYKLKLDTSLDATLGAVKDAVALRISLSKDSFHLRRQATGAQLKDESKTLGDLEFTPDSILHVQLGAGCALGETMISLNLDLRPEFLPDAPADLLSIGDLPVRDRSTIGQLKEVLLSKWAELTKGKDRAPATPASAAHIRLRDGKGQVFSPPLRDDRVLNRCLLGLDDGRRIVLQVLSAPEVLGPNDYVISVRVACYGTKAGTIKGLSKGVDMPFNKATTVQQLYEALAIRYPALIEDPDPALVGDDEPTEGGDASVPIDAALRELCQRFAVAKAPSTGPALMLKDALKLKWNDRAVVKDSSVAIEKPPFTLRDGSILVLRGQADFYRAKHAAKLRKEEEAKAEALGGAPARPTSRAAVRPGSRGVSRPKSRGTSLGRNVVPKEKSLNISLQGEAPSLPEPSPDKASSVNGSLPSAPPTSTVKMVQALRGE